MFARSVASNAAALLAVLAAAGAVPIRLARDLTFDYGSQKVQGVNLGGWFVLEPWITPSLFSDANNAIVDEWTLTQSLGTDQAQTVLSNHWNTWIVEDDFNQIAAAGLNHVRIPIGYWAIAPLPGDPYVQGQLEVLDQAIGWARNAGLKVWLDLHGAPLSQNGFDNSGHKGTIGWLQGDSAAQAKAAIQGLAQRYASATDVVTAIELVNEPMGPALDMDGVRQFYYDGWGVLQDQQQGTVAVIHDAFQPLASWNGFMTTGFSHVLLDTHQYQIFTSDQVAMSLQAHIAAACALGPQLASTDLWTVVGEMTGAMTDCTQWLNGRGIGARYDGTYPGSTVVGTCTGKYKGNASAFSDADKVALRRFVEAQLDAYERHTGWIWWTWKAESAPEWNLQALLAAGLFPQPLSQRLYPNQCEY